MLGDAIASKNVYFEAIWSFDIEVSLHVMLGFNKRLLENFGS